MRDTVNRGRLPARNNQSDTHAACVALRVTLHLQQYCACRAHAALRLRCASSRLALPSRDTTRRSARTVSMILYRGVSFSTPLISIVHSIKAQSSDVSFSEGEKRKKRKGGEELEIDKCANHRLSICVCASPAHLVNLCNLVLSLSTVELYQIPETASSSRRFFSENIFTLKSK